MLSPGEIEIVYFGNDWFAENRTSSHHIARRLAARFPLLYVESPGLRAPQATSRDLRKLIRKLSKTFETPRQIGPRMWHMTLPQIPFRGLPGVDRVNAGFGAMRVRGAARQLGFKRPVTWFTVPHPGVLAGRLGERLTVYYCIDDYSALPSVDSRQIARLDENLSRRADLVFVCSQTLFDAKRKLNDSVVFSPHGVDVDLFRQAQDGSLPLPEAIRGINHPVVGMFGLIDGRLDFDLIAFLARSRPRWTFLLVGHTEGASELAALPNIILPGPVPYETLPRWAQAFDVCIMPYKHGPFALSANPLKLREYLACGKPVVSIPMPSAEPFRAQISLAETAEAFLAAIEAELAQDCGQRRRERTAAVAGSGWDAKIEEVLETVGQRLPGRGTKEPAKAVASD